MTATVALALLATPSPSTGAVKHGARPLPVRLAWLEQRAREHTWICRHGNRRWPRVRWHCAATQWTAKELAEARAEYERRWQLWLPDKFARVGACETGYGRRPGQWDWDSGRYVSAFGIYRPAYDQFARRLQLSTWNGRNTPYEQYLVADAIRATFGWGAWGCGNA